MKNTGSIGVILSLAAAVLLAAPVYAGTITGTIKFEGKAPKMPVIDMSADPICASKHDKPVHLQALVLGEGQTMANVFVSVIKGLPPDKTYPVPKEPVVLTQAGCMFSPHVFGVRAGQPLEIRNPDGTLHNVHAFCTVNESFNLAMPKFKKTTKKIFPKPEGMFPIRCDVHSWMSAYCVVMAHPFFDVTGKDGKFTIKNLPAGTYEIEARQERLGPKTATVTIKDDETKTVDFSFSR